MPLQALARVVFAFVSKVQVLFAKACNNKAGVLIEIIVIDHSVSFVGGYFIFSQ